MFGNSLLRANEFSPGGLGLPALTVDGSGGEGGGQMFRTAIALSAITGREVFVKNIRANRPKPGLAAQHLAGLKLLSEICGAEVSGGHAGSTAVRFVPGDISPGDYALDIGTAGSISLALQTVLPALAVVPGRSTITLTGGTDVKWSPPIDYCNLVLFPMLRICGLECKAEIETRGYYPEGGGRVVTDIRSSGALSPLVLEPLRKAKEMKGIVNVTGLPIGIAERVRASTLEYLPPGLTEMADIRIEHREEGRSHGVGIVLAATDGNACIGASSLGERGKPSEKVGREAAEALLPEFGASVDTHASDQLLPYIAVAGGKFTSSRLTKHAGTNARVIGEFLGDIIRVEDGNMVTFSKGRAAT